MIFFYLFTHQHLFLDTSPTKRSNHEENTALYPGTCKPKIEAKSSESDLRRIRSFPSEISHKCDSNMGALTEFNYPRFVVLLKQN